MLGHSFFQEHDSARNTCNQISSNFEDHLFDQAWGLLCHRKSQHFPSMEVQMCEGVSAHVYCCSCVNLICHDFFHKFFQRFPGSMIGLESNITCV